MHIKSGFILLFLIIGTRYMPYAYSMEEIPTENTTNALDTLEVTDTQKLIDVYNNKTASIYYDASYKSARSRYSHCMQEDLWKGVEKRNLRSCLQLIALGTPLHKPSCNNTLLHHAAKHNNAAVCQFLLNLSLVPLDALNHDNLTPLLCATQARSPDSLEVLIQHGALKTYNKQAEVKPLLLHAICTGYSPEELPAILATCKLLILHGENPNAVFIRKSKERFLLDEIDKRYYLPKTPELLPLIMQCGMRPDLSDKKGQTHFYRVKDKCARCCLITNIAWRNSKVEDFKSYLCNFIVHYQHSLEIKEIITLLAMHKFHKDSLTAQLPKVVLRYHIIPLLLTFKKDSIDSSIELQLARMRTLFALKPAVEMNTAELNHFQIQAHNAMLNLLDPNNVEQHRAQLTELTHTFLAKKDLS